MSILHKVHTSLVGSISGPLIGGEVMLFGRATDPCVLQLSEGQIM